MPKDKDAKSSKSKDKDQDKKASKSKDKDTKSAKSKDKDAKSTKSKDKDAKSAKSKDKDKKSSKSGKETASKDKGDKTKADKPDKPAKEGEQEKPVEDKPSDTQPQTAVPASVSTMEMGGTIQATSESPFGRFANPHVTQFKICMLHSKPLKLFCDTCEELLCYDCTVMGPHNTQLHRICSLEEAFRYRYEMVNKAIHTSIVPKRAQLIG